MAILAIDFGTRRIGLAIAESTTSQAFPLDIIKRDALNRDLARIKLQIEGRDVTQLVVGLPLNMDGTEGSSALAARKFGGHLGAYLGLPVDYCDERLTSFEVRQRLADQTGRRRKTAIDALAATVILEEWLAGHQNQT